MKPGVQKPHWAPPCTIQATCRGWGSWGVPMPSMVVTAAPSATLAILVTQERTSLPSRITLQQPHWPSPQPTLVPVSPNCWRITLARDSSESATTVFLIPLITRFFLII